MNLAHVFKRVLTLLLAVILAGTPLSPVFAKVAANAEAHAMQAAHDGDHRADGSVHADHGSKTCTQHDSCAGQCCAHCFGAVSLFQPAYIYSQPVQTPVLSLLHSLVLITSLDRPPRTFSL